VAAKTRFTDPNSEAPWTEEEPTFPPPAGYNGNWLTGQSTAGLRAARDSHATAEDPEFVKWTFA